MIIASYQAAAWVADAVRSALEQTDPPHEVIVCDDGSTDDTAAVLAPFGDAITLIRQDNRGEAGARNTAIASGVGGRAGDPRRRRRVRARAARAASATRSRPGPTSTS